MNQENCGRDLPGYYRISTLNTYCYLVSWTIPVPDSGGMGILRRYRYLCRKCVPGQLTAAFARSRPSVMERHFLQEHGIAPAMAIGRYERFTSKCTSPEGLYRAPIPPEDLVKGGSIQSFPDEMLWRWAYASEEHGVPRNVGTPTGMHKVGFRVAETPGDHADLRKSTSDSSHHEEKSRGLLLNHWNEEFWLQLIDIVKNLDDLNMSKHKWTKVPALLSPDLVAKFDEEAVSKRVLGNRFFALHSEVQGNLPIKRYTRGVTEAVVTKMREYCKKKTSFKKVQRSCGDYKKRTFSKNVPFTEADLDKKLGKQFNSVVKMLDNQLLPTAKLILESSLNRSKKFFSETETTQRVYKKAIKVAFQEIRREVIFKIKEMTGSLSQEIMHKLKEAN